MDASICSNNSISNKCHLFAICIITAGPGILDTENLKFLLEQPKDRNKIEKIKLKGQRTLNKTAAEK